MTNYRRFILPLLLIAGAAVASVFAPRLAKRLRDEQQGRKKAALDEWENEGGNVAAADVAVPRS